MFLKWADWKFTLLSQFIYRLALQLSCCINWWKNKKKTKWNEAQRHSVIDWMTTKLFSCVFRLCHAYVNPSNSNPEACVIIYVLILWYERWETSSLSAFLVNHFRAEICCGCWAASIENETRELLSFLRLLYNIF